MAKSIIMPKSGMAMEEGVILRWLKKVGDPVEKGEPVLEVETDKTNMEVEADYNGVLLAILREEGETVPVTEVIGWIGEPGEEAPEQPAVPAGQGEKPPAGAESVGGEAQAGAAKAGGSEQPAVAGRDEGPTAEEFPEEAAEPSGKVKATPAARRAAGERGIDICTLVPSGMHGEVRERDVEAAGIGADVFARHGGAAPAAPKAAAPAAVGQQQPKATPLVRKIAEKRGIDLAKVQGSGPGGKIFVKDLQEGGVRPVGTGKTGAPGTGLQITPGEKMDSGGADRIVPLTKVQKITAERMYRSHNEIPAVTIGMNADVTRLLEIRNELNQDLADKKISVNDLVVKAAALSLRNHRRLNAEFQKDRLVLHGEVNINVAVDTDQGLMIPVLRNADLLTIPELSGRIKNLIEKARSRKLLPEDTEGGTFTVTNVGMQGVTYFTPIINQPQTAILGVCTIEEKLVRSQGEINDQKIMTLCLTFDHRAMDGAEAARFLAAVKEYLEKPYLLIME